MDLSPIVVVAVVLVGSASGVLAGMVGVGGAVVTTPGIRFLGASPIEAVGSTIPAILPASIAGTMRYHRAGLVAWPAALVCGSVGSAFSVLGAWLSDIVDAHLLMLSTAGLLGLSAVKTWRDRQVAPPPAGDAGSGTGTDSSDGSDGSDGNGVRAAGDGGRGSVPGLVLIGTAAGLLAGLLGVGGGLLLVPGFTHLVRLEPKRAIATSLPAVAIVSIPAMVTHAALGHVNWSYAALLTVGVVPGARIGARFTIGGSESRLRLLMTVFFGLLAVVYGARELNEIL